MNDNKVVKLKKKEIFVDSNKMEGWGIITATGGLLLRGIVVPNKACQKLELSS